MTVSTGQPHPELVDARFAYVQFMKRYASSRDSASLSMRKYLERRLAEAEAKWERGRTGPEQLSLL